MDACLSERTVAGARDAAIVVASYVGGVFALFAALGLRFSPRIRDVADQRLWRVDGADNADFFGGLLRGKIDEDLILGCWDDILRVAGSLKMGWVTSSLLVSRLQAKPRKNALTRALQEYGRLEKTIFLLRYAESEDLRRRIGRQLNKGEERRFLFFANEGHVRKRQPEEQTEQALCLNLLTDCVILWNTVRYGEILDQLRTEGFPAPEEVAVDAVRYVASRVDVAAEYGAYDHRGRTAEHHRAQTRGTFGFRQATVRDAEELGRAVKTVFLCEYLSSLELRREVHEGLNTIESWNAANSFIFYGKGGEVASNRLEDQEVSVLSLHLLQLALVYVNTLMIQEVLASPSWTGCLNAEDLRGLTPLIFGHVNPYGRIKLDKEERLPLGDAARAP